MSLFSIQIADLSFWAPCLSPWLKSDLLFHPALNSCLPFHLLMSVLVFVTSSRTALSHSVLVTIILTRDKEQKMGALLPYMWSTSFLCAETGGQGSSSTRHSYTATADCSSTPSLASGRLWNTLGNHLECKMQKQIHYSTYIQHTQLLCY